MLPLTESVVMIVGWTFAILAVAITPILVAAMIMRQLRWIGFSEFDRGSDD